MEIWLNSEKKTAQIIILLPCGGNNEYLQTYDQKITVFWFRRVMSICFLRLQKPRGRYWQVFTVSLWGLAYIVNLPFAMPRDGWQVELYVFLQ